jgi:predicted O-methyltransferase YrrM
MTHYHFTMDFNRGQGSYINISHLVNTYGVPTNVCEIGIYEGATTFWMCDNLTPHNKNLKIYAIDPHNTSTDLDVNLTVIKENFEYNLDLNTYNNVKYINKTSEDGLIDLINDKVNCELIYIDGDHRASVVLTDLVLAWKILAVGGVILCDDTTTWKYTDKNGIQSNQMSPRLAVETFIQCNWHKIKILSLPDSTQTAFIKMEE